MIDNPKNLDPKNRLFLRDFATHIDCAWPNRLQHFINNIIGDIVEVTNGSVRGTGSSIGKTLLEENTIVSRHPDIIINAYSTNDEAGKHAFSNIQEFVRYVLRDEQCQKPLLIHFFDVIPTQSKKMIAVNRLAEKGLIINKCKCKCKCTITLICRISVKCKCKLHLLVFSKNVQTCPDLPF